MRQNALSCAAAYRHGETYVGPERRQGAVQQVPAAEAGETPAGLGFLRGPSDRAETGCLGGARTGCRGGVAGSKAERPRRQTGKAGGCDGAAGGGSGTDIGGGQAGVARKETAGEDGGEAVKYSVSA